MPWCRVDLLHYHSSSLGHYHAGEPEHNSIIGKALEMGGSLAHALDYAWENLKVEGGKEKPSEWPTSAVFLNGAG